MKILFLSKRVYTNKDLVRDRYGRVYEFSSALAGLGHRVCGLALDYRRRGFAETRVEPEGVNPEWYSRNLFPNPIGGLRKYIAGVAGLVDEFSPDVLISVSDVYHVILGDWLARQYGITHVIDIYDNYEIFKAARLPGMVALYRRALSRANGVVCVSRNLKRYVLATCNPTKEPEVITNAVNEDVFTPHDKDACRRRFGLQSDKALIGLGGAMFKRRGMETIFQAHRVLADANPDIHLVLAGSTDETTAIPESGDVHYLGKIDYRDMPLFYGALDVGIIINRDTSFARYCFPQKFFEMLACGLPMVVAAIGDVKDMMAGCSQALFRPGDANGLAEAILMQHARPCRPDIEVVSWERQGALLSEFLEKTSTLEAGGQAR